MICDHKHKSMFLHLRHLASNHLLSLNSRVVFFLFFLHSLSWGKETYARPHNLGNKYHLSISRLKEQSCILNIWKLKHRYSLTFIERQTISWKHHILSFILKQWWDGSWQTRKIWARKIGAKFRKTIEESQHPRYYILGARGTSFLTWHPKKHLFSQSWCILLSDHTQEYLTSTG